MISTEVKLWFLSSLEHFWPDPWDALSEVALFFEKMHKIFKNKAQGCSTPLNNVWLYIMVSIQFRKEEQQICGYLFTGVYRDNCGGLGLCLYDM